MIYLEVFGFLFEINRGGEMDEKVVFVDSFYTDVDRM
jgi:hypothetical protein